MIKYVGPVVIYKIPGGLFEHERFKPANIRTSQGSVQNLAQVKQIINLGIKI